MAESINVTDAILDKKMDSYTWESKNYVADREITITITLDEYRDLVKRVATSQYDIDKANKDQYERNQENKRLKEEVEQLRAKIYSLQNKENESEEK